MSRYRDDTQETAVASDATWLRLGAVVEDFAKASSALMFGLLVLHVDAAAASDEAIDRGRAFVTEQAMVSDTATDHLHAAVLLTDQRRVAEAFSHRLRVLHEDAAQAADGVIDTARSVTTEQAAIHDEVIDQRRAHSLVRETARVSDFTGQFSRSLAEDTATAGDWAGGRLHTRVLLADTATLADELIDQHQASDPVLVEQARASDAAIDHLHALNLVQEVAVVEDSMPGEPVGGQAWTANADTWAMSRYAPFAFNGLAVIDGVLYGTSDAGVFRLGGRAEVIEGSLTTGKLDIGGGALVHPHTAYLEYELADDGSAVMDVSTTQSGATETYSYPLEREQAEELTNGRFKFGRGLRGRHFTFALRLTGNHAYINDLSVESTPTKRRV